MKRASFWAVSFLSVALSLPALAAQQERPTVTGGKDVDTLKLLIDGGVNIAFAYEDGVMREAWHYRPGGIRAAFDVTPFNEIRDPYYFFNGPAWVDFRASFKSNIEAGLTLRTVPYTNSFGGVQGAAGAGAAFAAESRTPIADYRNWGDASTVGIVAKYAWLTIHEFLDPAWHLTIGQQDIIWDVRGPRDGAGPTGAKASNPLFLDVAHSESPWAKVSRAWAMTVRDEMYPVGFKLEYKRKTENFGAELGIFPVVREAGVLSGILGLPGDQFNQSHQQAIYYIDGSIQIDNLGSKLGIIGSLFHGVYADDNVFTVGGAFVFKPQADLELFGEVYYQFGQPWSHGKQLLDGATVFDNDGKQSAYAARVGGRFDTPGTTRFFAEADLTLVSGQNAGSGPGGREYSSASGFPTLGAGIPNRTDHFRFMSYEHDSMMLILNSNEWGFDFDSNIMQITVQAGVMLSTPITENPNNLMFLVKGAYAMAPQKWVIDRFTNGVAVPGQVDEQDIYGFEIDFTARLQLNKSAGVFYTIGYLFGSDILKSFTVDNKDNTYMMLFGVDAYY